MKVINKPVEMVAYYSKNGIPTPMKFRIIDGDPVTVKIGRVIDSHQEKVAGQRILVYLCESVMDDIEKRYELNFAMDSCCWTLYKI